MIKTLIRSYLLNIVLLFFLSQYIPAINLTDGAKSLLIVAGALTLLHLIVKLLLNTVLGSLNFITLGIVGLVLDTAVLYGLTIYLPQLVITDWVFPGLNLGSLTIHSYHLSKIMTAGFAAFIISTVRILVNALV